MSELFCLGKTFNPNLVCLGKTFDSNLRESQVNLLTRRAFTAAALVAGASTFVPALGAPLNVAEIDRRRVIRLADQAMKLVPRTITSATAPRSAGGVHDYYSEGDYWWPDPANPGGPYIRRDGLSNPDKFDAHRDVMIALSLAVPALAAAFKVSGKRPYAQHAARHLDAWFVNTATRMNPNLNFAQAIIGVNTGRGIGVIDTLHLVEVARAVAVLESAHPARFRLANAAAIKQWFAQYLTWLTTSKNGLEERAELNNHGSCWILQAAEFARLTGNAEVTRWCRTQFKAAIIPNQIAPDGKQPLELARTKPYSYCLFNLDVMASCAHILSTKAENLWTFKTPDGRSLQRALAYMVPYIRDKATWPHAKDVEQFENFPVRHPCLLFGGLALAEPNYVTLWKTLNPDPVVREVIRSYPVRQPLLWM
jgi:Alginate lyase